MLRNSLFFLLALLLAPLPSCAQLGLLDAPETSPLWWPLAEDLSSADLREKLFSREDHQQRYRVAMEEGMVSALSPGELEKVTFYVDGRLYPELVPFGSAWNAFSKGFYPQVREQHAQAQATAAMKRWGVSPSGADVVMRAVFGFTEQVEAAGESIGSHQVQLANLIRSARSSMSESQLWQLAEAQDAAMLSAQLSVDEHRIARHLEHLYNPVWRYLPEALATLRETLQEDDWSGLRKFLLHEVAHTFVTMEVETE